MSIRIEWISILLAFSLILVAYDGEAEDKPEVINFGVATVGQGGRPQVGGSFVATAHAKGLLEEEFKADGIKVRWHFFKTAGPGVNEAYTNNLLDLAWQGDLPQIIGKANGLPTKFIMATGRRAQIYVAATEDSSASSVKDLAGRKVAIFKGTCLQLTAARILEANGMSEKDLKVYNMDTGTTTAALASKDIEAAFGGNPLFSVRDRGLAKIIYDAQKDNDAKYGCSTGVTVTEEFAEKYPDITKRVVKVLLKAADWSNDPKNRTQVYQIWGKSGFPFKYFQQDNDGQDFDVKQSPLLDEYFIASYRKALNDAKRFGLVRNDIDLNQWFDHTYLDAALKELKYENRWKPEQAEAWQSK
ncbi:ABC transporter substrate-binding protein [Methylococcus mesophilus]|uniref:ABC transporter substrate-binding protein n=1 Tax=Methylococcus mesophilus TaxID=2993564 RepID=UPI00224B2B66|nr:ABC transporter substrate-binding protein [Methylococcus mesophilus]UZR29584.1 ABC transporter substrate-binding protein [Methylococcus mesophilus]